MTIDAKTIIKVAFLKTDAAIMGRELTHQEKELIEAVDMWTLYGDTHGFGAVEVSWRFMAEGEQDGS